MRNYDEIIKKHNDFITTGKKDFLLGVRVKVDNPNIHNFINKNIKKLKQSPGAAFFIETESKELAQGLIKEWPYLKDALLQ